MFLHQDGLPWYYVPFTVVALALSQLTWRRITVFVAISALGVVPWLAKQKALFGTLSTTTFTGYHQAGIISYTRPTTSWRPPGDSSTIATPWARSNTKAARPLNTESVAVDNLVYAKLSAQQWAAHRSSCIEGLWAIAEAEL